MILVLNTLPPSLNDSYGHNGGRRYKKPPLLAFEAEAKAYMLENYPAWQFQPKSPLVGSLWLFSPRVFKKPKRKLDTPTLSETFGDVDDRIKHAIDAVFRCYADTNDAYVVDVHAYKRYAEQEFMVLQLEASDYCFPHPPRA